MSTPTTTFRLSDRDLGTLDRLASELAFSRTDVVRTAIRLLQRDRGFRDEVRAASYAAAFLGRLREEYGPNALVECDSGAKRPVLRINGQRVKDAAVKVRQVDDLIALDLIDTTTQVAVRNAYIVGPDEPQPLRIPLAYLWVATPAPLPGDRSIHSLPDGRSAVEITEDDGSTRRIVLDKDGASTVLEHEPQAVQIRSADS